MKMSRRKGYLKGVLGIWTYDTSGESFEEYSVTQCFSNTMSPQQILFNELKCRAVLFQKKKHELGKSIFLE